LLVRASAREREIGIRTALGAGRGRLIRQMLTESVLLSLLGAFVGIVLARVGVSLLAAMAAQSFPRLGETKVDMAALTFTIVVALATGILFGLFPALQSARGETQDVLKEGSQATTAGRGRLQVRRVLVAAEVALSLLLLVSAGLLIKSFMRLQQVDAGFDPSGVLTMRIVVPPARYSQPDQVRAFYREVLRRVAALPGVTKVGANNGIPLTGSGGSGTTTIDNPAFADDRGTPEADQRIVTPGAEAMGMTLLSGRMFDERDTESSQSSRSSTSRWRERSGRTKTDREAPQARRPAEPAALANDCRCRAPCSVSNARRAVARAVLHAPHATSDHRDEPRDQDSR
jgi:hypothetical protein